MVGVELQISTDDRISTIEKALTSTIVGAFWNDALNKLSDLFKGCWVRWSGIVQSTKVDDQGLTLTLLPEDTSGNLRKLYDDRDLDPSDVCCKVTFPEGQTGNIRRTMKWTRSSG